MLSLVCHDDYLTFWLTKMSLREQGLYESLGSSSLLAIALKSINDAEWCIFMEDSKSIVFSLSWTSRSIKVMDIV